MRVVLIAAVLSSVSAAVIPVLPLSTSTPVASASRRRNTTRVVSQRRLLVRSDPDPAPMCGPDVFAPCDKDNRWCCDESTQCVEYGSTWTCAKWHDAMECSASETPCMDGISCCGEDSKCGLDGGCVAEIGECDAGATDCINECCTEREQCDFDTGRCLPLNDTMPAFQAASPPPTTQPIITTRTASPTMTATTNPAFAATTAQDTRTEGVSTTTALAQGTQGAHASTMTSLNHEAHPTITASTTQGSRSPFPLATVGSVTPPAVVQTQSDSALHTAQSSSEITIISEVSAAPTAALSTAAVTAPATSTVAPTAATAQPTPSPTGSALPAATSVASVPSGGHFRISLDATVVAAVVLVVTILVSQL